MHLVLSPVRGLPGQAETTLSVSGDVLTCDGVAFDLAAVPEGGSATPLGDAHPFLGPITRVGGTIHATIRVFLGDDALPEQPRCPHLWTLDAADGPVGLPVLRSPKSTIAEGAE